MPISIIKQLSPAELLEKLTQNTENEIKSALPFLTSGFNDGQTWQDLTASRLEDTDYLNDTGSPIEVYINLEVALGSKNFDALQVSPDGASWVTVGFRSEQAGLGHSFIVPNGWFYKSNEPFYRWSELR